MKRVFLYAYDKQNLGDDLFVHAITNRHPEIKFYMWSSTENKETYRELSNLKVVKSNSLFVRFLSWLRPSLVPRYRGYLENRCTAVVYIGGSLFIEYPEWEMLLTWWEYEAEHRPFYILGANFGPYKSEEYKKKLAEIFAKTKDVCFRDHYSKSKFENVETVRYAPDILFGTEMPERRNTTKRIFISVIDCTSKSEGINQFSQMEEDYLRLLQKIADQAVNAGYQVMLSSFCKEEGDEFAVDKLCNRFKYEVTVLNYDGTNANELLQAISDSDFVVASRFHAAILGFAANKPVLPVVYSDKTIHVLKDAGFDGFILDVRNLNCNQAEIERILEDGSSQKLNGIDQLRRKSTQHFLVLDKAIMGKRNE